MIVIKAIRLMCTSCVIMATYPNITTAVAAKIGFVATLMASIHITQKKKMNERCTNVRGFTIIIIYTKKMDTESVQDIESEPDASLLKRGIPLSSPSMMERDSLSDVDTIRIKFIELVESDKVNKSEALSIMHLFHAMESLLVHECNVRDKVILETKSALERNRLETECDRLARRHTLDEQSIAQLTEMQAHPRGNSKRR
jgi:hypothetical protein